MVLPLGRAGGLQAACWLLNAIPLAWVGCCGCNLACLRWLALDAVAAILPAVVGSGSKFGSSTGPPAGQSCGSHLCHLRKRTRLIGIRGAAKQNVY
jgi:hypothetical protein